MRRLHPGLREERLDDLYLELEFPDPPAGLPYLYLDMVMSADGAATAGGRTGPLGGPADRLAFSRLREWCDAILVGAATVRIEHYGPPRPREDARHRRVDRGLAEVPRLVVVTASLDLDPGARLFSDPARRPLLLVPELADPQRRRRLEEVADIVPVESRGGGEQRVEEHLVDLRAALAELRRQGLHRVLCEGGPILNSELLDNGLVHELFLTISPQIVGVSDRRIVEGPLEHTPLGLQLLELREHEGELLCRYRVVS